MMLKRILHRLPFKVSHRILFFWDNFKRLCKYSVSLESGCYAFVRLDFDLCKWVEREGLRLHMSYDTYIAACVCAAKSTTESREEVSSDEDL